MVDTVEIPLLDEREMRLRGSGKAGKVAFDDRGNAVWQYATQLDESLGELLPTQTLDHPGLAIVDDEPAQGTAIPVNSKGLKVGYNPYESGRLAGKKTRKPRDMRELSRWIELRKKLVKE